MLWNVFYFRWGTVQTFQNAFKMFLHAFQHFEMGCTEKRLNTNFVKPGRFSQRRSQTTKLKQIQAWLFSDLITAVQMLSKLRRSLLIRISFCSNIQVISQDPLPIWWLWHYLHHLLSWAGVLPLQETLRYKVMSSIIKDKVVVKSRRFSTIRHTLNLKIFMAS